MSATVDRWLHPHAPSLPTLSHTNLVSQYDSSLTRTGQFKSLGLDRISCLWSFPAWQLPGSFPVCVFLNSHAQPLSQPLHCPLQQWLKAQAHTHTPHTTSSSARTTDTLHTPAKHIQLFVSVPCDCFFFLESYPFLKRTFNTACLKDSLYTSYTWIAIHPFQITSAQALGKWGCWLDDRDFLRVTKLIRRCDVGVLDGSWAVVKTSID